MRSFIFIKPAPNSRSPLPFLNSSNSMMVSIRSARYVSLSNVLVYEMMNIYNVHNVHLYAARLVLSLLYSLVRKAGRQVKFCTCKCSNCTPTFVMCCDRRKRPRSRHRKTAARSSTTSCVSSSSSMSRPQSLASAPNSDRFALLYYVYLSLLLYLCCRTHFTHVYSHVYSYDSMFVCRVDVRL